MLIGSFAVVHGRERRGERRGGGERLTMVRLTLLLLFSLLLRQQRENAEACTSGRPVRGTDKTHTHNSSRSFQFWLCDKTKHTHHAKSKKKRERRNEQQWRRKRNTPPSSPTPHDTPKPSTNQIQQVMSTRHADA